MSAARDDYRFLYENRKRTGPIGLQDCESAMNEIDRLRAELERVTAQYAMLRASTGQKRGAS